MITRPMLASVAAPEKLELIEWPAWCSPKVDGIRCLIHPELGPVTRSFKSLPNLFVCDRLMATVGGSYLDGELIATTDEGADLPFNETQSAMMSRAGMPAFTFAVFDCFERPGDDFANRFMRACNIVEHCGQPYVTILKHEIIDSLEDFIKFSDKCIAALFEGAMIRSPAGPYKSGRSTFNQGWLLKYKNWADAEGTVIGFHELMHNSNADQRDEFDLAKRSSHKDNMVPMNTLGALLLKTAWGDLRVGTGFDMSQRKAIWMRNTDMEEMYRNKDSTPPDLGRTVTFKYQPFGMQDLPRFPVFKGFREEE